jgi:hypothetical protein
MMEAIVSMCQAVILVALPRHTPVKKHRASEMQSRGQAHAPRTGQIATRTDALLSRRETGKTAASIIPVTAGWHPARAALAIVAIRKGFRRKP